MHQASDHLVVFGTGITHLAASVGTHSALTRCGNSKSLRDCKIRARGAGEQPTCITCRALDRRAAA